MAKLKLIAALDTRDELGRYLPETLAALLEFCDEVRAQDDGSTDGTAEYLEAAPRVEVIRNQGVTWRENEGALKGQLFAWALEGRPSHIFAVDADELVTDGAAVRRSLEANPTAHCWTLRMVEIWQRSPALVRIDGQWRPHSVGICYRVPPAPAGPGWRFPRQAMAAARVPPAILAEHRQGRAVDTGVDLLHLGWSDPDERERRFARYAELDAGRYHAAAHLRSILGRNPTLRAYP